MVNVYQEIVKKLETGEAVALETVIRGESGMIAEGFSRRLTAVAPREDLKGRMVAAVTAEQTEDGLRVTEPMLPQERLLVLGGGHIALHVVEFAAKCGFSVIVADIYNFHTVFSRLGYESAQVLREPVKKT